MNVTFMLLSRHECHIHVVAASLACECRDCWGGCGPLGPCYGRAAGQYRQFRRSHHRTVKLAYSYGNPAHATMAWQYLREGAPTRSLEWFKNGWESGARLGGPSLSGTGGRR